MDGPSEASKREGAEPAPKNGNTPDEGEAGPKKPLPEIIPPEAVEALRQAGIDSPEKAAAVIAVTASISRSPFPAPDMLRAYDDYRPGMGGEVVEHVRDQTRHRQALWNANASRVAKAGRTGLSETHLLSAC